MKHVTWLVIGLAFEGTRPKQSVEVKNYRSKSKNSTFVVAVTPIPNPTIVNEFCLLIEASH